MDLLSVLGDHMSPIELESNKIAAKGDQDLFFAILENDYKFSEAIEELKSLSSNMNEDEISFGYFSLENWESGVEGLIGDAWFNFVQFVKKVVRTIRTALNHFFSGMTLRLRYMEKMKIKLLNVRDLNVEAFEHSTTPAYSKNDFIDLFRGLEIVRRTLNSLFMKQDFDLDGIMEFRQYGITFVNGAVHRDLGDNTRSSIFDLGYKQDATKELFKLGWNFSALPGALDKLIEFTKYDLQKDFDFIKFQSAMDKLIRSKEKEAKTDWDEIRRLTNIAKTVSSMVSYNANTIWKMSRQMVTMLKALEEPIPEARSSDVY